MGGINAGRKPNLSIKSRSALFYTIIGAAIVIILTVIAISIKLVYSNAASEGTDDTGVATLDSVEITQAGTGQSVTIKGETLNENDYGTDNAARRTILNNNVVRYNVNYNVTTPGRVTLSITMPANNVIDEATIAESQHCLPGLSKLEPADITNSDGTVTKSYTNNKATCVRDIADIGNTNWQITAYAWGANNAQIQPTLAVSGVSQDIKPETITVVGKADYTIAMVNNSYQTIYETGYNLKVSPFFNLHASKRDAGILGIAPIDDLSFTLDMSNMPANWSMYRFTVPGSTTIWNIGTTEKINSKNATYSVTTNGNSIEVELKDLVTGTYEYADSSVGPSYFVGSIIIASPVGSLNKQPKNYSITTSNGIVTVVPDSQSSLPVTPTTLSWTLSNASYGAGNMYTEFSATPVGWHDVNTRDGPVYIGGQISAVPYVASVTYVSDYVTNLAYCSLWQDGEYMIGGLFQKFNPSSVLDSDMIVEYGVIDAGATDYSQCMQWTNGDGIFLSQDLNEASEYASAHNAKINALRIRISKISNVSNARLGILPLRIGGDVDYWERVVLPAYASASEWAGGNEYFKPIIVPGLLAHTITAVPSSANPGNEDHITITTKTYNKDTNSKVTVDLPAGLTPKAGSFTITTGYTHNDVTNTNEPNKVVLVEGDGQDYTLSSGCDAGDGCTVIFDLDHIAAAHNVPVTGYDPIYPGQSGVTNIILNSVTGLYEEVTTTNNNNTDDDIINDDLPIAADNNSNGIVHANTPIEFDVTINEDTPSPSTLTINSTTSGDGTKYAATSFKSASDTIAVAEPPRTFGYNLTADKNNIYAGEELTYTYNISNLTSDTTTDIAMVAVLPFNGDSRGTTGLADRSDGANPYTISNLTLSLSSDEVDGLDTSAIKLYYTPDVKVRELESDNPEALAIDESIAWQELVANPTSADGDVVTFAIPSNIASSMTAIKLVSSELASDGRLKLNMTLDNILAATPGGRATLGNDITYLAYTNPADSLTDTTSTQAMPRTILRSSDGVTAYSNGQVTSTHKSLVTTGYLGELLSLSIPTDEQTIQVELNPNEVVIGDDNNLVNHLSLSTATLRGYNLTARTGTDDGKLLSADQARFISAVPAQPVATTAGWSAKVIGSNNPSLTATSWAAIPGSNQTPLNLYASTTKGREGRRLTVTYGFSAGDAVAGEYSANVIYTLTAEP